MQLNELIVSRRETGTKGKTHALRRTGHIPGILYGSHGENVPISIDKRVFDRLLQRSEGNIHQFVSLKFSDGNEQWNTTALIKTVDFHPVKGHPLHIDFVRVRMDERVRTTVPVELHGQAKGFMFGGIAEQLLRKIEIECVAAQVPSHITVDISSLGVGDSIHVGQITPPEGVTLLDDPEKPVVTIVLPRGAVASETAETGTTEQKAEPETVKKGKEKEE